MNKLLRIPFTDRALVIADDPHGQAEHYPGGLSFNTTATAEHVRGGEVIDRYELGSGVITTAGINKWAAMLNAKQGPLYSSTTTALGPYMIGTGTGTTAPAITDTSLQTAIGTTGTAYSSRTVNLLGFNVAGVAYGNGVYVAVGGTGGIATSTDAVNWTVRTSSAPTHTNTGVAFGNGVFLLSTQVNTIDGSVLKSTDNGATWITVYSQPSTSNNTGFYSITFGGSQFVAVSRFYVISSTDDGGSWTIRYSISGAASRFDGGTVYTSNGYFMVGGTNIYNNNSLAIGSGSTWYATTGPSTTTLPIGYFNSKYYFILGNSFATATTPGFANFSTFGVPVSVNSCAIGGSVLVLVGASGSIYTSTNPTANLVDYTARTSDTTANLTYVTYQNGQFIAFAGGYLVLTSSDGSTWTKSRTAISGSTTAWFSANSTYLMWGGSEFARSSNATTWYKQPAWFKFTTSYSNPYAVSEFGIFGGNTSNNLSGATLFDRRTFSAINVTGGDSINWYWGVTGAAGG